MEQQISTNTNLTQLIALTQGEQVLQASTMVGKQVIVQSDHIPLQNGTGRVNFAAPSAQPVALSIYTDGGVKVRDAVLSANAGPNSWTWDGTTNSGAKAPDGSYRIAMIGANADGSTTPVHFTVQGTATGITRQNNAVQLQMGMQTADFSTVQQVLP